MTKNSKSATKKTTLSASRKNTATKLNAARPEVRKNIRIIPQCSAALPAWRVTPKKRSERERSCALLVDKREGKPLGDKEGPFRIVILDEKRMARWVRQVKMLKIAEVPSVLLDHRFGRLHDCCHRVALLKLQLIGAATGNDALDEVVADPNDDVR